ncbi:trigger factor [Saccharospirillum sp. MSK14-1]|uniref:trigger factor n=1 Tax=Saccharospirillum sp. MSK14-1 TaxID=1897632 RepID=UPI000D3DBBB6|nr:trigger factor [Saccharospirillum sp. MSK14-1]PTY36660.1 trigger factor [Saccharospirillum sp. MSK14-1]
MQVSVEATGGLERRLTVGVPASEVDGAVDQKLKETARRVRIDGFRPGKVPVSVVKQRFGDGIRAEVLQDVVQQNYAKAITEEKLTPAGMPSIEFTRDQAGEDVEFVATFEVFPEVKLAEISGYSFDKPTAEVTDADIDKMIDNLRQQKAEYKPVERAAQKGDQVKIDFVGKVDGEVFDGGSATDQMLVLGSGQMIPGFEDGIEGIKIGDTKAVEVTFPEEYGNSELAGKPAVFDITVKEVAEPELPEMDEAFFQGFGSQHTDVEGFKTEVRANMEREARNALQSKLKTTVIDKLLEDNDIDVPAALVDDEIGRLQQQAVQQFGGGAQMDPSSLPKELFQDQAERRVKIGLLMNELIESAELKPEEAEVRAYVEDQAAVYQDPQQVIDYYYSNAELMNQVRAMVVENAAIDYILSKSKVNESTIGYEDAVKSNGAEQG